MWEVSGYVRTHNNTHVLHIPATALCPSIKSFSRLFRTPVYCGMFSLKNHRDVYKVLSVWWGGGACPPNTDLSARAGLCTNVAVRVFAAGPPPDYSCDIIKIDQICFVA